MKIKTLLLGSALIVLGGCASSPKNYDHVNSDVLDYCENVSSIYGQVHDLKGMGASRVEAMAFFIKHIDEDTVLSEEDKLEIKTHAGHAVNSIYASPKISKSKWVSGIKDQCIEKPGII